MERLVVAASRQCGQLTQCKVHGARDAVVAQGEFRRFTNGQQRIGPVLGHGVVRIVDNQVRVLQINDRLDFHIGSTGRVRDRYPEPAVGAIFTKQRTVRVEPFDVQPHAAPFRIAADQLVSREIDDLERVPKNLKVGRLLQVFLRANLTKVHSQGLDTRQSTAEPQVTLRILVLHNAGKPVVATGLVMHGHVQSLGRALLVTTECLDRPHVTALAAEVARRIIFVVTARSGDQCCLVGRVERAAGYLQIRGQASEIRYQCFG